MKTTAKKITVLFTSLFLLVLASACTPKDPSIRIDYDVPDSSDVFKGKKISLKVTDRREDKNILDPAAFTKFENFNGKFSFAHKNKDALLGIYDAPGLFKEAVKTRLVKQGLKIAPHAKGTVEIQIIIKEFSLKFKSGWKAKISIEAQLNKDGKYVSKERISNTTENKLGFKSSGVAALESAFSEIINKLNFERLFIKSNL